jgi:hypothetical protein
MLPLSLLFKRFLKLGATAYGGPAMTGQIKQAVIADYGWIFQVSFSQEWLSSTSLKRLTFLIFFSLVEYFPSSYSVFSNSSHTNLKTARF